ncbi:MAG: hypothetical protein U0793_32275 [Gemmataceae bacterium]
MATTRLLAATHAVLLTAFLLVGCRRGPEPLTPVQGKVTYKGLPVTNGTIVFTPDGAKGGAGRIAFGKIGPDGAYALMTGEAQGATPGVYRVTVVSLANTDEPKAGERFRVPLSLLPEKYRDPELSELSCEVKASKTNVLDIALP